jgi:23S rRNA (cytosine1962-C5)-methyltransferase
MKRLRPGGLYVACSCSHHVGREDFAEMLRMAARDAGRQFRVLPHGGQPHDHAPLLALPETEYLKVMLLLDAPDPGIVRE